MPPEARDSIVLTGFKHVPANVRGLGRDLRIGWALKEIGKSYGFELFDAFVPRGDEYRQWHPYGLIPAFDDGDERLFESGAILLYLGERDERLLPTTQTDRWQAVAWLFAALNSIEPFVLQIAQLDFFLSHKEWAAPARANAVRQLTARLRDTEAALGSREWFAGTFSVADIAMVTVFRVIGHTPILSEFPALTEYRARAEQRPAFQDALNEQFENYSEPQMQEIGS